MNRAGKSTRKMAQSRRRTTNFILIGVFIVAIVIIIAIQSWEAIGISSSIVIFLLVLLRILPDLLDKPIKLRIRAERRADRGAAAEEVVGSILAGLNENFFVLHDITSPYGNIDHVVICKNSGVFLLETKSHRGRVEILPNGLLVNGKPSEKDFIAQALKNTYWLRDGIEKAIGSKIWITPVVVFTNAFVQSGKPIKGVIIINKKFLLNLLYRQGRPDTGLAAVWDAKERFANLLEGKNSNLDFNKA